MQTAAVFVESATEEPRRLPDEVALDDIHNATIQRGLDIWNRARGARPYPARAEVTPRMLSDLLRYTTLTRVLENNEYELRIVGDTMVPGQIALTRIPLRMKSAATDLVKPTTAAFVVPYT